MNKKREIVISVLLYIATFAVGILVGVILGTDFSGETEITTTHWIISIIFSIILAAIFSFLYFKGRGVDASGKQGLKLGLFFLLIGIIFDALFLLPYVFSGSGSMDGVLAYYLDPLFYVSVLLIILTPVVVGMFMMGRK